MNFSAERPKKVLEFDIENKIVISSRKFYVWLSFLILVFITLGCLTAYTVYEWNKFRVEISSLLLNKTSESKTIISTNFGGINERIETLEKLVEPLSLLNPEYAVGEAVRKVNTESWRINEERFNLVQKNVEAMELELAKAREKSESGDRREVIYISLINLINKVNSTAEFHDELKTLAIAAKDYENLTEDLNTLQIYSQSGIPDKQSLSSEFTAIAHKIITAEKSSISEKNLYERVYDKVTASVKIRKVGYQEGQSTEEIVARAEEYMKRGNINLAVNEVHKLRQSQEVAEWLQKATSYVESSRAISKIIEALGKNAAQAIFIKTEPVNTVEG